MTHLFAKLEITKANNSTLLRVTIPCIRGSLRDLQNFFKLSLAKNFELSKGIIESNKVNTTGKHSFISFSSKLLKIIANKKTF